MTMAFKERPSLTRSPGTRDFFLLRAGQQPNGDPVHLPVMAVHGHEDGPTVLATACLHGNEVLGSDVVRKVALGLDPSVLAGSFVGLPMVNVSAVGTRTRRSVVEQYPGPHDMNRIFPGKPDGLVSERIAHLLIEDLVPSSDYVVDLHNASVGGRWLPYALTPPPDACPSPDLRGRADELAQVIGFDLVLEETIPGSLAAAAVSAGTPATLVEFGVANVIDPDDRDRGIRAVTNVLRFGGVLPGDPVRPDAQARIGKVHRLTASHAGYLEHLAPFGSSVQKGQPLAEIQDLAGDVVERFHAPHAGIICRRSTMGVVGTGDLVVYVGQPSSPG